MESLCACELRAYMYIYFCVCVCVCVSFESICMWVCVCGVRVLGGQMHSTFLHLLHSKIHLAPSQKLLTPFFCTLGENLANATSFLWIRFLHRFFFYFSKAKISSTQKIEILKIKKSVFLISFKKYCRMKLVCIHINPYYGTNIW